jgi:hypothetical protein
MRSRAAEAFCLVDTHYQESKPVVEQIVGKTEAYQEFKSEDKSGVDKVKAFCLADTRYQAFDPARPFHEVSDGAFGKNDLFSLFSFQPCFSKLVSRRRSVDS